MDLDAAVRAYQKARDAVPVAQEKAAQLVADARAEVDRTRGQLADAIVAAYNAGARQVDLVEATGYTRESIRRILRAAGVEAD